MINVYSCTMVPLLIFATCSRLSIAIENLLVSLRDDVDYLGSCPFVHFLCCVKIPPSYSLLSYTTDAAFAVVVDVVRVVRVGTSRAELLSHSSFIQERIS